MIASLPLGSSYQPEQTFAPGKNRTEYEPEEQMLLKEIEKQAHTKANLFDASLRGTPTSQVANKNCVQFPAAVGIGYPEEEICRDEGNRMLQSSDSVCVFTPDTNGADHDVTVIVNGPVDFSLYAPSRFPSMFGFPSMFPVTPSLDCELKSFFGSPAMMCNAVPSNTNICVEFPNSSTRHIFLLLKNAGHDRPLFAVASTSRWLDPISHSVGPSAQYYKDSSARWMRRAWPGPSDNVWVGVALFAAQTEPLEEIITHPCAPGSPMWTKPHGHTMDHTDFCLPFDSSDNRKLQEIIAGEILASIFAYVTVSFETAAEAEVTITVTADTVMGLSEDSTLIVRAGTVVVEDGEGLVVQSMPDAVGDVTAEHAQVGDIVGTVEREDRLVVGDRAGDLKHARYVFSPESTVQDTDVERMYFQHETKFTETYLHPGSTNDYSAVDIHVPHDVSVETVDARISVHGTQRLGANHAVGEVRPVVGAPPEMQPLQHYYNIVQQAGRAAGDALEYLSSCVRGSGTAGQVLAESEVVPLRGPGP